MKRFVTIFIIALLLATLGNTDTIAQEENNGQLWFCWEATVHPEMQNQFIDLQLDLQSKLKEHGFPYTFYTWTDGQFGYYFFYPVDSYDDKTGIYDALGKIIPQTGEVSFNRMWETVMSHRTYFLHAPSEFSYIPDQPRLDVMDMPYAYWDILYVKPEKEMEFVELLKKLVIIQQDQKFDDPVQMLLGDIGYEGSVYIGALKGKDGVDFRVQNQKMWKLMGEEGSAIFQKMMSMLRKRESKQFWYSEELSYVPEE
jgi:hypothetical protein